MQGFPRYQNWCQRGNGVAYLLSYICCVVSKLGGASAPDDIFIRWYCYIYSEAVRRVWFYLFELQLCYLGFINNCSNMQSIAYQWVKMYLSTSRSNNVLFNEKAESETEPQCIQAAIQNSSYTNVTFVSSMSYYSVTYLSHIFTRTENENNEYTNKTRFYQYRNNNLPSNYSFKFSHIRCVWRMGLITNRIKEYNRIIPVLCE